MKHICQTCLCVNDHDDLNMFTQHRSIVFLILLTFSLEWCSTFIMFVVSDFYLAISDGNKEMFQQSLYHAVVLIAVMSLLKAGKSVATEQCALLWRYKIVHTIQLLFVQQQQPINPDLSSLDSPDQRVRADADE